MGNLYQNIYEFDGFVNNNGNSIHETAIIYDNVNLGRGNVIGAYSVIGSNGEMRGVKQKDFKGKVIIGDNNVISEHVTIHAPYKQGEKTIIGDNSIIMAHSHIGHNAEIGSNCEICTTSVIGGYAIIKDNVKIKLHSVVRNRVIVEEGVIVGMGSVVTKDVAKGSIIYGNPAKEKSERK